MLVFLSLQFINGSLLIWAVPPMPESDNHNTLKMWPLVQKVHCPQPSSPFSPNRPLAVRWTLWSSADGRHLRNIAFSHSSSSSSLLVNLSLTLFSLPLHPHFSLLTCFPAVLMWLAVSFRLDFLLAPLSLFVSLSLVFLRIHECNGSKQSEAAR